MTVLKAKLRLFSRTVGAHDSGGWGEEMSFPFLSQGSLM